MPKKEAQIDDARRGKVSGVLFSQNRRKRGWDEDYKWFGVSQKTNNLGGKKGRKENHPKGKVFHRALGCQKNTSAYSKEATQRERGEPVIKRGGIGLEAGV